ncbi:MAG: TolC family protein, partial [Bacteroidales bacterium]
PFGFTEHDDIVYTSQPSPVYEDYPFFNQLEDNANTSVMLNLSIPIFNGWQTRNRISNAKVSVLNAQYQLEDTKNRLYKEIQDAYSDALAAWKRYIASERTVESMEESFKYTKQKFEVGMVNSVEYNTAKNDLTKAESDLLQAKYEYIFKSRILDFYQGKPLVIE